MLPPNPPRSIAAPTLLAVVAVLALVGCGSPPESPEADAAPPPSASPTTTPSPTPSPSPSPIEAADGTDLAACSDGDCEVAVTGPAEFEVDPEFGIDTLTIDSTTGGSVALTMTSTASEVAFGCEDTDLVPCDSTMEGVFGAGASSTGRATGEPGAQITLNDLILEVVDVTDDSAVVRIEPA